MRLNPFAFAWVIFALGACSSSSTTIAGQGSDNTSTGGSSTGGPSGTGGGSATDLNCANYCATVNAACGTASQMQYKSSTSCLNSCPSFALGSLADTSSNSLGCRFSHALAAQESPDQNCAAAGPSGGGTCGSACDAYCSLMAHICPTVYEDAVTCSAACHAMLGSDVSTYHTPAAGDTLQCRIYHSTFAAEGSPELHCVHASSVPTLPCAAP